MGKTECERSPSLDDLDEKYQGELCYRGRNIMMGYLAQPDLGEDHVNEINKKTRETIDSEGWLHSGDKGMVTARGMVKITGRYKELIIGAGGENIAPVPIEDHVKKMCDGIAEVIMIGDKRKYNVALVTLKAVGANGEVPGTDELDAGAARVNPEVKTISEAIKNKQWIDTVAAAIQSANANGKVCFNNAAKIQKFTILPTNFSEQGNELTPTKKLKRAAVEKAYADIIEKIYNTDGVYIEYTSSSLPVLLKISMIAAEGCGDAKEGGGGGGGEPPKAADDGKAEEEEKPDAGADPKEDAEGKEAKEVAEGPADDEEPKEDDEGNAKEEEEAPEKAEDPKEDEGKEADAVPDKVEEPTEMPDRPPAVEYTK